MRCGYVDQLTVSKRRVETKFSLLILIVSIKKFVIIFTYMGSVAEQADAGVAPPRELI